MKLQRQERPIRRAKLKVRAPEKTESEIENDIAYYRRLVSLIREELHLVSPAWRKFSKTRGGR